MCCSSLPTLLELVQCKGFWQGYLLHCITIVIRLQDLYLVVRYERNENERVMKQDQLVSGLMSDRNTSSGGSFNVDLMQSELALTNVYDHEKVALVQHIKY